MVTFAPAAPNEAIVLAEHRAAVWMEVGDWGPEILDFIPTWTAYLTTALADGSYRGLIARDGEAIVASAGMHLRASLPRPERTTPLEARVQGVYVVASARRRGIARKLMEQLMAEARAAGAQRIVLHPSDEARGLYLALGFTPLDELAYNLTQG